MGCSISAQLGYVLFDRAVFDLFLLTTISQLSSVQTIRDAHLQIVSIVRTAAHCEEDGRPACRRCGVQDQPLMEGVREGKTCWPLLNRKSIEIIVICTITV